MCYVNCGTATIRAMTMHDLCKCGHERMCHNFKEKTCGGIGWTYNDCACTRFILVKKVAPIDPNEMEKLE